VLYAGGVCRNDRVLHSTTAYLQFASRRRRGLRLLACFYLGTAQLYDLLPASCFRELLLSMHQILLCAAANDH